MIQDNNLSYDDINVDPNMGNATNRIYSIEYQKNLVTQYKYTYTYDASHNITNIVVTDGSVPPNTIDRYDYYYDGFNQLVREDIHVKINLAGEYSKSITYTYDYQGNITHIKEYNYSNGSLSGTPLKEKKLYYANAWGDQVTKIEYYVSGTLSYYESYSYDNSGNLLHITDSRTSYYNDYLNWDGRSLVSRGQYCETDSYQYNDQGIRTKKTVATCSGTTLTNYILDGDKVLVETWGSNTIYYTYDVDGTLLSMNYNGNEYFYITNMQGDIIELVDISGNTVVEYKYDAWGNIVYQTPNQSLGDINPYRYRGYRFDEETGFYYLNSRYYNPVIGRFISSDGLLGKQGDTIGHNMYAYCANNPVMYSDITGYAPEWLKWTIGGIVIAGCLAAVILSGGSAIAFGAFAGSMVGGITGLVNGISLDEDGFHFDSDKASTGFMLGSIVGAISGSIGVQVGATSKLGVFAQRSIMASVNGTLSLGAYISKAAIDGDSISFKGAMIALGSGLFSFADPTGYKVFDAFWGPMMGAELGWTYDLLSDLYRKSNTSTRMLTYY